MATAAATPAPAAAATAGGGGVGGGVEEVGAAVDPLQEEKCGRVREVEVRGRPGQRTEAT